MHKNIHRLFLTLALSLAALCGLLIATMPAFAQEGEVHHLAFASDYHGTEGSVRNAMGSMPADVEYVSLVGDLVGDRSSRAPEYSSQDILSVVQEVFPALDSSNVSLIWADHDANVIDEPANVVACKGGYGSGLIYQGRNDDGSAAYYIYAVGFYEMKEGGDVSRNAAAGFKAWVDGIDPCVPVIVLCHMPLQSKRGDNLGASYWNEALNYAATGVEGIDTTDETAQITRNVIFLCGHNHTVSRNDSYFGEFYFGAGTTMEVQVDTTVKSESQPEATVTPEAEDGESGDTTRPARPPRPKAEGVASNIYYTSLVAGYLKTSGNATLITIDDKDITLEKHNDGQVVALGYDAAAEAEVLSPVSIAQFTRTHEVEHASVSVSKVDETGSPLSGATFALSQGEDAIATYEGGSFTVSTEDAALTALLPSAGKTSVLSLEETVAPLGYVKSEASHEIEVLAKESETLVERTYVDTTTYDMTIDGERSLVVANEKAPSDTQPATTSATQPTVKPSNNASTPRDVHKQEPRATLPKTADASIPCAWGLLVVSLGAWLVGVQASER